MTIKWKQAAQRLLQILTNIKMNDHLVSFSLNGS